MTKKDKFTLLIAKLTYSSDYDLERDDYKPQTTPKTMLKTNKQAWKVYETWAKYD